MTKSNHDGFQLDLRNFKQRRGRGFYRVVNPFAVNSSPLEHHTMVTAGCHSVAVSDPEQCRAERWADHLTRCLSCWRSEIELKVRAFAIEHAADLAGLHS